MNVNEAKRIIAMLKLHAPNHPAPPQLANLWAETMDDVPYEAANAAVKHWMRTHKGGWFPAPSEIREIVLEKVCGLPSVDDALAQLERSVRENYIGQPVKYTPDRLVIEAARTIGGTYAFRNAQSGFEVDKLRERFRTVYAEMRRERAETADIAGDWAALPGASNGTPALAGQNGRGR